MNIGQICSKPAIHAPESAPLSLVAKLMTQAHVGVVVITHGSGETTQVSGIITDRDLVRAQLERTADLSSLSAGEIMSRNPLVLAEHASVDGAIADLRARNVRRAPVVDQFGSLIGLISVDDLLRQVAAEVTVLAAAVLGQSRREQ